jgi:uncharacterized surface protein with fasciclin (FAS1) repeats
MNLKRFLNFMKHALLTVMVLTTIGITSCDDDDGDDGPKVYDGTVLQLISDSKYKESSTVTDDKALDSLAKYINLYPELTAMLSGSADVTLFAPSNKAFKNLLATPGFPANISLISPDVIENVLAYHIVNGEERKADLTAGTTLSTNFTDPMAPGAAQIITVNTNGTLKAAPNATNTDIDIVVADNLANNGVVHIVESVMIPPSTGAVLVPILGTMAGTVLLGKDFTYLASLVMKADAGFAEGANLNQKKIVTLLALPTSANPNGSTFFAIPNAVITAIAGGSANVQAFLDGFDATEARALLLNHYVAGTKFVVTASGGSTTITNDATTDAVSGTDLTFKTGLPTSANNPYGVIVTVDPANTSKYAPIVVKDVSHSNGIIQVIAGMLM